MTTREEVEALAPTHLMKEVFMTDEEYEGNKKNCDQLRHANSRLVHELMRMGMEPDFTAGMLSVYFDGLVAAGVITKAQLLVIQLGWETTFHNQLQKMQQQAEEHIARSRLAVPGGRPEKKGLLIPGRG